MRKHILALLLLVPILLIPLVSCDGDVLGSLSDFMGKAGGNALLESGTVVVDTSQGATMVEAAGVLAGFTEVPASAEDKAAYKAEVEKIQDALADALAAPGGTKATKLKEDMGKPAGSNPPKKVSDKIDDIEDDLGITIETETRGDLIAAILMVETLERGEAINPDTATDEELLEFVSDALQVIEIVRAVSPANAISLDNLISDLIGDDELMNSMFRGSRTTSRDGEADDALTYIEPIFDMIIKAIGTEDDGYIHPAGSGLKRLTSSFAIMKLTYESMAPKLAKSKVELELTDVINYTLSVVFTEANGFFATVGITFAEALNDVIDWQNDGKEGNPDFVDNITNWEDAFDDYMQDNEDKFIT
ncbi:MAG: hypothetical protein WC239_08750, partial [Sphaerochaetaceae bacterium]